MRATVRRLPFVIRAAAPNASKIVVIVPVNTWAAYNGWGGKSLYDNHSVDGVRASVVSFEKPWADGVEIQNWRYDEYPLVRFLERQDLDVSYITDWDVSSRPGVLAGHRVVVTMGHGEYWTKEHRDALEAARDAGQSLAFLGANLGYWQVRYSDGGRSLIGYKSNADPIADPALKTDLFRNVGRPECQLIGVQYNNTSWPLGTSDDMSVVNASLGDPWFAGSGFTAGASVIDSLGYEWDQVTPGCATPPLTRLFHWQASGWPTADGVRYTAPSGAKVFGAGTLQYAWGLDGWRWSGASGAADPRLVAFTMNMLTDMGGAGSSEPPPPAVTVTPASATLPVGGTQQFTATLQNATGGVTWSVDGGATNGTITSSGLYTAPASAPGGGVTVRATHTASGATDTATVTVTAPTQPQVTTQPTDQTALAGGSATFTAAACGTPDADGAVAALHRRRRHLRRHPRRHLGHPHPHLGDNRPEQQPLPGGVHQQRRRRHHQRGDPHRHLDRRGAAGHHPAGEPVGDGGWDGDVHRRRLRHPGPRPCSGSCPPTAAPATPTSPRRTPPPSPSPPVTTAQNSNRYRAVFTNSAGAATTNAATLTVTAPAAPPARTAAPSRTRRPPRR